MGEPYVEALWYNFAMDRTTVTADLLSGKLVNRAFQSVRGWLHGKPETKPESESDRDGH